MSTVYLYRVYCVTEGEYVTTWDTTAPTTCPNNNTHAIDPNSIAIINRISSSNVTIKGDQRNTQGHYKTVGYTFNIPAGPSTTVSHDVSYPYATSIRSSKLIVTNDNVGDHLDVVAAPNTTVGITTANVSVGDTVINVDFNAIAYIEVGYKITLDDGTNTSELGEVVSVDTNTNNITVITASDQNYTSGTSVQITVSRIENLDLLLTGVLDLGTSEVSGTDNPSNAITRLIYTNNSSNAKQFQGILELYY